MTRPPRVGSLSSHPSGRGAAALLISSVRRHIVFIVVFALYVAAMAGVISYFKVGGVRGLVRSARQELPVVLVAGGRCQ